MRRRRPPEAILRLVILALAVMLLPLAAQAQAWPQRAVRWVVPFPAGGSSDVTARILAQPFGEAIKQQLVIDNRGGAAGNIGAEIAAKSPPDGYTMLFSTVSLSINETLYKKLPFDLHKDLVPVVLLAQLPNVMVVPASLPVTSVQEFVAYAKARPGQVNFGSGGNGTSVHVNGEFFKLLTGIDIIHVPYKGDGPAMQDLIAGQIQMVLPQLPGAIGHIRGGALRALGVTSAERSPMLPDVPAIGETVKGFDASGWYGVFAPAGTPPEIIAQTNEALNAVLKRDDVRKRLLEIGTTPLGGPPEDFARFLDADIEKWGKVVRAAKVTIE